MTSKPTVEDRIVVEECASVGGHIELSPRSGQFYAIVPAKVAGSTDTHERQYATLAEARAYIERVRKSREQTKTDPLNIEVMTERFDPFTVRGVHGGNGTLLTSGIPKGTKVSTDTYWHPEHRIFPVTPGVQSRIATLRRLQEEANRIETEMEAIRNELKPCMIEISSGYRELFTREKLVQRHTAALELAKKLT